MDISTHVLFNIIELTDTSFYLHVTAFYHLRKKKTKAKRLRQKGQTN